VRQAEGETDASERGMEAARDDGGHGRGWGFGQLTAAAREAREAWLMGSHN